MWSLSPQGVSLLQPTTRSGLTSTASTCGLDEAPQNRLLVQAAQQDIGWTKGPDAYDNSVCERLVAGTRTAPVTRHTFKTEDEARLAVSSHSEVFQNPPCRHRAPGYLSPVEYEKMIKENCIQTVAVQPRTVNGSGATS